MNWAYLEDQTDHMSITNIACFRLRAIGEKVDNPSSFMYGDRRFCGLGIIHVIGMQFLKRFAQLARQDSANVPLQLIKRT